MAAGCPTRAAGDESAVICSADQQLPGGRLLLEMTLQTERLIPCLEHLVVHRPVRIMTSDAPLAQRFVFENKRALLRHVTLDAGVIHGGQLGSCAHHCIAFV